MTDFEFLLWISLDRSGWLWITPLVPKPSQMRAMGRWGDFSSPRQKGRIDDRSATKCNNPHGYWVLWDFRSATSIATNRNKCNKCNVLDGTTRVRQRLWRAVGLSLPPRPPKMTFERLHGYNPTFTGFFEFCDRLQL